MFLHNDFSQPGLRERVAFMQKKAIGYQSQPWRETRGWLASVPDFDALLSSSREPISPSLLPLPPHWWYPRESPGGKGPIADARGLLWANSRAGNKRGLQ